MTILETKEVSKTYAAHKALDKVSVCVEQGDVFGLLGPNGAGKTTLIRMINQITAPDEGEIFFCGNRLRAQDVHHIGYLPEERGLYKKMKVGEQAVYLAQLKGMDTKTAKEKLKEWFTRFDIMNWWDKKVEELSKGMAQKVQFITTVLHEPKLLIFDEPFSGFDPLNANLLKEEILNLRDKGASIIFSTHNMSSVEEICDKIALINKSKKILDGSVKEIKQRFKKNLYELVLPKEAAIEDMLVEGCYLQDKLRAGDTLVVKLSIDKGRNAELLSNILKTTDIISYRELLPSMNEIFIQTVQENE